MSLGRIKAQIACLCKKVDLLSSSTIAGESSALEIAVDRKDGLIGWAGIRTDGTTFGADFTPNGEGQWTMTFTNPHPLGAGGWLYSGSGEEDGDRDNPKITMVDGTDTANGASIMVTVDDNGTTADIFEDNDFSFIVYAECKMISQIYINGEAVNDFGGESDDNSGDDQQVLPLCSDARTTFFNQQQFAWGFQIQSAGNAVPNAQYLIEGANYPLVATDITNNSDFVLTSTLNADSTYDHLFDFINPLPANSSTNTYQIQPVNFGFNPTSQDQSVRCG